MVTSDVPSEEVIRNYITLTDGRVNRERAVKILQFHNNNPDAAVGDYFDNFDNFDPDSSKYDQAPSSSQNQAWDETVFNSNRDGTSNNALVPSFNIQSSDELPQYGPHFDGASGAPSRPPSRMSHSKSPHNIIDLSDEAAKADPSTSRFGDISAEDADLNAAIAASLKPQENGIIGTDQVAFGPATRNQYEQGKWDLVPISKTYAQDILLDLEPADRKRDIGVPAFLKPTVEESRLAALFTIFHEIPMTRELFLDRLNPSPNYGSDKDWWSGKSIELPLMIEDGTNRIAEAAFVQEIQRLMAFLDKTDRSYGSADALANSTLVKRTRRYGGNLESAVLAAYKDVFYEHQGKLRTLFSRGVDGPEENNAEEFSILDLPLPDVDSYAETIYDIADEVLWPSGTPIDLSVSPYLTNVGEVITFRFTGGGDKDKKSGVTIPAVWYPDRYLESGRQAAYDMRKQKLHWENQLQKLSDIQYALTNFEISSGNRRVSVKALFDSALQHDAVKVKGDDKNAPNDVSEEYIVPMEHSSKTDLSQQLRNLLDRIDKKLEALVGQKEKTKEELRALSKLYTQPSDDPDAPALHRYTLRGVSTSKNIMYICRQAEPDLMDMNIDSEDSQASNDQWWKISYEPVDSKPFQVAKTTENIVLEEASKSSKSLLVYASEKAMAWTAKDLPKGLDTFVRKDNALFKKEFPSSSPISSPASPGKRKIGSTDSSDEALQEGRYPTRGIVEVTEREVGNPGLDGAQIAASSLALHAVQNGTGHEMIMGVDPNMDDAPIEGQEMQERPRSSMPRMLSASTRPIDGSQKPLDIMDMDEVMEDDIVANESGAVKQAGFME